MTSALGRLLVAVVALAFAAPSLADPPGRVGRISLISGSVSLAPAGAEDQWSEAYINRPITHGDRLWAADRSRAEVRVGSTAVRLDARTSADVLALDDRAVQLRLAEGRLQIRVRAMAPDSYFEIDTPSAAVVIRRPGVYRVDVRPDADVTTLVVRNGEAEIAGNQSSLQVRDGEQVVFVNGGETYDYYSIRGEDDFDRFCLARDSRDDRRATRYVSVEMTGYEDLAEYGSWSNVADYGNVWFPSRVEAAWAPYRDGRWVWVEPWGWTWVDNAPWGFAPFHYGRWVRVRERWGWVPGEVVARPVYAPALVAWVGGPNFSVSVSGGNAPAVGWFPIAYREPYIPWYEASPTYIHAVNVPARVTNINITNINVTQYNYTYRRDPVAVTAVPAPVVVQGQSVTRAAVRLAPQQFAQAPIIAGTAPVAPTAQSVIARTTSVRPPAQVEQRRVTAVQAPPPPPATFAARQQAIAQHGNQPFQVRALPPRGAPTAAQAAPAAPGATPPAAPPAAQGKAATAPTAPAAAPATTATAPATTAAAAPAVQVIKPAPTKPVRAAGAPPLPAAAPGAPEAPAATRAAAAKGAPEAPKAAEAAKAPEAPRAAEAPKAPETPKAAEAPKGPTEAPKGAAEARRGAPEAPKAAMEPPKGPPETPKAAAEAPKGPPEAPRGPPETARGRPGAPSVERPGPGNEPGRAAAPAPQPRETTPPAPPSRAAPAPEPAPRAAPPAPREIERPAPPAATPRAGPMPAPERAAPPSVERATPPAPVAPREAPPAPRAAPPSPPERAAPPAPEARTAPRPAPPERAAARPAPPERAAPAQQQAERPAPPAPPRGGPPPEREAKGAPAKGPPEKGKQPDEKRQEEQRS